MLSGVLARSIGILELLAKHPFGLPIHEIAAKLDIPKSAAHRVLTELVELGYVRQPREHGDYALTLKLCSLGLSYLTGMGVADVAQPVLNELACVSGEVARLSVIEVDTLVWVAKAQGPAVAGLRFDPDQGGVADLISTASGHAWLSHLPDQMAVELIARHGGFAPRGGDEGPSVPRTKSQLLTMLRTARQQGFAIVSEAVHIGIAAVAAPVVYKPLDEVIAVISIAGPHIRLTDERLRELGPILVTATASLAASCAGSPFLQQAIAGASQRRLNQASVAVGKKTKGKI